MSGLLCLLSFSAAAHDYQGIDQLIVTSSSSERAASEIAQPAHVLDYEALQKQMGDTLGSLLANTPGVANASFGPGVGRPVLRGMSGNRVRIMINGNDASDVSAMSSDHAAMAEPVNASQVEVIQGPSTLLYGGGAIGGIVNIVESRIHQRQMQGIHGMAKLRASSADSGYMGKAVMDIGHGNWVFHVDGFDRRADDYQAAASGQDTVTVANSDTRSQGGSMALTLVDDEFGHLGFAGSFLNYDYAVPNEDDRPVRVTPDQNRFELSGALNFDIALLEMANFSLIYDDYQHEELDGSLVEGLFLKEKLEFKTIAGFSQGPDWQGKLGLHFSHEDLQLCHDHSGCDGIPDHSNQAWDGTQGTNFTVINGFEFAHDNPMPLTEIRDMAAFMVQEYFWAHGIVEFGLRGEHRKITADPTSIRRASRQDQAYYRDKTFTPVNITAAATWVLHPQHRLGLSIARAQRAPDAEEIYWNGDHHATFSYQLDNPDLDTETAYTLDINWHYFADAFSSQLALYYYDFDGYIYNDLKSVTDPFHGNAVYRHEQADARLYGAELSFNVPLDDVMPGLALDMFADYVRAQLKQGENRNLPRTPPASASVALNWQDGPWFAQVDGRFYAAQNKTAANESRSAGYASLNAQAAWQQERYRIALKGQNLGNSAAANHVSYLKDFAPVMGRNLVLELSVDF